MRQGESGSFHYVNQFTTDAQSGQLANPLFVLLGPFSRLTHLPLIATFHLARLGFGFGLLMLVWKFIRLTVANARAQILAYLFVCFAAGLGWIPLPWDAFGTRTTCPPGPIDLWQPEAITFLSLYLNPLFLAAMCLQVGILMLLLLGERTGRLIYAVCAGLCGLLLALVHSYDVLTIFTVWLGYLLILAAAHSSTIPFAFMRAGIAGIITTPGVLFIYQQLQSNPIFRARANVETLTAHPHWVILGYGLTFALACCALVKIWRDAKYTKAYLEDGADTSSDIINGPDALILLTVWLVVNLLIAYLPGLAFQRKLLQGAHFPIAILAGIGGSIFIERLRPNADARRFAVKAFAMTLILAMTNIAYVFEEAARFSRNETKTGLHRSSLLSGEVEAMQWIAANTPPDAAIQPLPWQTLQPNPQTGGMSRGLTDLTLATFAPALSGRKVYCGHFGETPDFNTRFQEIGTLALGKTSDETRIALLRRMNVQYILFSQKSPADEAADILFPALRGHQLLPPCLTLVHSNPDADIYAVHLH